MPGIRHPRRKVSVGKTLAYRDAGFGVKGNAASEWGGFGRQRSGVLRVGAGRRRVRASSLIVDGAELRCPQGRSDDTPPGLVVRSAFAFLTGDVVPAAHARGRIEELNKCILTGGTSLCKTVAPPPPRTLRKTTPDHTNRGGGRASAWRGLSSGGGGGTRGADRGQDAVRWTHAAPVVRPRSDRAPPPEAKRRNCARC